MKASKGQVWYFDFIIAFTIFIIAIVLYSQFSDNLSHASEEIMDDLLLEARIISSSLMSEGFPVDWNSTNVNRIGIMNPDKNLNITKYLGLSGMDYNALKSILQVSGDFIVFFQDGAGNVLGINGICSVGHDLVQTDLISTPIAYVKNSSVLEQTIEGYNVSIFRSPEDLDLLFETITDYDAVVFEDSHLDAYGDDSYVKEVIANYSYDWGTVFLSGDVGILDLLGANFSEQFATFQNVSITSAFGFEFMNGDNLTFAVADYYLSETDDDNVSGFVAIGNYTKPGYEGRIAVAYWKYGYGKVFYLPSYNVSYFSRGNSTDFLNTVVKTMLSYGLGSCSQIVLSAIEYDKLVKNTRIIVHDSEMLLLKVYVWQD